MEEHRTLSRKAYEPATEDSPYEPFVPASETGVEFTARSIFFGIIFGIIFGSANAYLGLRAGLTISTSIPVAVMTVAAFKALRKFGQPAHILEANMSQTMGSASSSVASGIIFTLPALFLWGFPPDLLQMTLLAMSGGILGILFMIPLRKYLIDREHGNLPYPEGTACAEVLVASESGGDKARNVFYGLGIGAFLKFLTSWVKIIPSEIHLNLPWPRKAQVGLDVSAALFGVGYILGPRISSVMVGGGLLSWLVLIPAIAWWGSGLTEPVYPEAAVLIRDMDPGLIWTRYIRYIGAGAVAAGGIIALIKSIPVMLQSFRVGVGQIRENVQNRERKTQIRTDRDISLRTVLLGLVVIAAVLTLVPHIFSGLETAAVRFTASLLIIIFAFFFVTVSSRIVGMVGVTSNPTSGMTIAALLGTSVIFLLAGWTDDTGKVTALTVGAVVAIAASIAGDTSQDLKTGFLLGATPRNQQIGELAGVLTSAVFVCLSILLLDKAFGFGSSELPAPQANLMKVVIEGVLQSELPWTLVGIGVGIAVIAELAGISSLAFAVGVYLPLSTFTPLFLGGMLRYALERSASDDDEKHLRREQGILLGSGLVGGEGLLGVGIAAAAVLQGKWNSIIGPLSALISFGLLITIFYILSTAKRPNTQ